MTRSRRPRRKVVLWGLFGVLALAIIAIILVVILVIALLQPTPPRPGPAAPGQSSAQRPRTQPADCADVSVVVVPGSFESASDDDPYNPRANPNALLLRISRPLAQAFDNSRADVYTVPYAASFRNPTNLDDKTRDYNDSRAEGTARVRARITEVNQRCPLTGFVLLGFSQGAVIAGDVASSIGNDKGPVAADLVLGVGLIADGRRQPGEAIDVAPSPPGVGAEVSLGGLGTLVPGIAMTGSRPGAFGSLRSRTVSICAAGDLICDAPTILNPFDAVGKLLGAINNPIHALYGTTRYWQSDGASATRWLFGWSRSVVDRAPRPPHN
ncbi:cutinase family protein [Williamsia sp. CHRR-6]|uniref:cutinase family protein n=1 Tax=Williamsia sp. CHRR-6 TaxID=2835871 RepID=UPI001BD9AEBF|nr:cutinase family protein [Williamsia sp. CHRR-6]MBT0567579.1 cutinase family protein [Williamsia sp. CHRR-6]